MRFFFPFVIEKESIEDISRCYELAFQARKTPIERLSFCAGGNSGVIWRTEGDEDWVDGRIAGSKGVVPSSLEFWKVDSGLLCDLIIAVLGWRIGEMFELMLGVDDEFRASDITPFDLCSNWSDDDFSRSTISWYFFKAFSNAARSVASQDGITCQLNRSWRTWLTDAWSWKSL